MRSQPSSSGVEGEQVLYVRTATSALAVAVTGEAMKAKESYKAHRVALEQAAQQIAKVLGGK